MKGGFFLVVLLLLSLGIFFLAGNRKVERTFFFPEIKTQRRNSGIRFSGEERIIPRQKRRLDNIRLVIEEIILGPLSHKHSRLVSPEVTLYSLVLDQNKLFLNLSGEILNSAPHSTLPPEVQIQAIGNTILYNFPFLKKVYVFIEGQIPDFSVVHGEDSISFINGINYTATIPK